MKKLLTIIRLSGYRGYLPIETLSAPGKDYNPFEVVPKFLGELRQAVEATATIAPAPTPEDSSAPARPATTKPPDAPPTRKPANKNKTNPPPRQ